MNERNWDEVGRWLDEVLSSPEPDAYASIEVDSTDPSDKYRMAYEAQKRGLTIFWPGGMDAFPLLKCDPGKDPEPSGTEIISARKVAA